MQNPKTPGFAAGQPIGTTSVDPARITPPPRPAVTPGGSIVQDPASLPQPAAAPVVQPVNRAPMGRTAANMFAGRGREVPAAQRGRGTAWQTGAKQATRPSLAQRRVQRAAPVAPSPQQVEEEAAMMAAYKAPELRQVGEAGDQMGDVNAALAKRYGR